MRGQTFGGDEQRSVLPRRGGRRQRSRRLSRARGQAGYVGIEFRHRFLLIEVTLYAGQDRRVHVSSGSLLDSRPDGEKREGRRPRTDPIHRPMDLKNSRIRSQ